MPPATPIAAPNPDDIPRAEGAWLLTYNGSWFEGKQNHVMGFVQTTPDEQKVWFTVNSTPHYTRVFYNRRYRTSSTAPWQWMYSKSVKILDLPSPGSAVVNAVLYSPTAKYRPGTGGSTLYKYAMFITYQPKACDGQIMGFAMVSYSNDGLCWTTAIPLQHPGGPSAECAPELGTWLVQVESFDVIDGGDKIYLIGMEGSVPAAIDWNNMDRTFTSWGYAMPTTSATVTIPANPELSVSGIVSPEGIPRTDDRFKTYSYLINPAMAWDADNGDLYVTRGYPYPFDRRHDLAPTSPTVPSYDQAFETFIYNYLLDAPQHVEGCPASPATFPNRVQIYKMHLGTLSNFSQVSTGTWTLVSDIGNNVGYAYSTITNNIPIAPPQTSVGRDYGAASFMRTGTGALQLVDGNAYMFAATQYLTPLSVGQCRSTGLDRSYLTVVPR